MFVRVNKITAALLVLFFLAGCGKSEPTAMPTTTPIPPIETLILPTAEPSPIAPAPAVSFEQSAQTFPSVPTFQIGLGDLDGDGDLDAVFANGQSNFSTVWLNDGNRHFADTGQQLTQQGHGVDMGDLDGDGDLDLFLTCHGLEGPGSGKPSRVYLNDGNGVFHDNGQDLGDARLSGNAANLADIDTDGDLDAIVAYYEHGNSVYLNDGKASFTLSEITFPTKSIWGDLDSDGDVDVFFKEDGVGYQSMLNDGTGNFAEYWAYKDTTAMIHGDIALGDIDNDGDLDAIVTNGDWRSTGYPALVFLNDDSGRFTDSGQRLSTVRNASANLGDLNGDGYLDLVFTDFEEPNQIWINDGAGQFFDSGVRFGADQFYRHAHLGDLDQDGDLDIFLATFGIDGGPNEVWLNKAIPSVNAPSLTDTPVQTSGDTRIRPTDGTTMVYVPAGEFEMGNAGIPLEQPVHTVALDSFWIDQTEVTNDQFQRCVEAGVCDEPSCWEDGDLLWDNDDFGGPGQPVVCVNWFQAQTYCEWAGGRFPTEAEWEYAARGPDELQHPWGNEFDGTLLNYCDVNCNKLYADEAFDDGYAYTAPVGSYPDGASWCGALDMAGNVWEWTADWFGEFSAGRQVNPTGPSSGVQRVIRGGAWNGLLFDTRGTVRKGGRQRFEIMYLGFRCASSTAP